MALVLQLQGADDDIVDDIVQLPEEGGSVFLGDGDDYAQGSPQADTIGGGSGKDSLYSGAGGDIVYGGAGDDIVYGDGGSDLLFGGDGDDTVGGGIDNDTIYGGAGDDLLFGGSGDDVLGGGAGNDTIWGGEGNDTIYGGAGTDKVAYEGDGMKVSHFDVKKIAGGGYRIDDGDGNIDLVYGVEDISVNGKVYDISDKFFPSPKDPDPKPFDPGTITKNPDGTLDLIAIDGDEPWHGDGNDEHNFSLTRNETHGLEIGLQIKERGGPSYDPSSVDADGTVHWIVPSGEGSPGRAVWSSDYSITSTDGDQLPDHKISWFLDIDPSEEVSYLEFVGTPGPAGDGGAIIWEVGGMPAIVDDAGDGSGFVTQNSQNVGFYEHLMDMDSGTPGMQPYDFSAGAEFDFLFVIKDQDDNILLSNHGVVHVEDVIL